VDWVLAFEFEMELHTVVVEPNIKEGSGFEELRQLVLNHKTATFLHHRSSFTSLIKKPDATRTVYEFLKGGFVESYITSFVEAELHVLYTLPVHSRARAHAVTDFGFSVVPFFLKGFNERVFQGLWGPTHHVVERNMIIFYGVVNGDALSTIKPPPPGPYGAPSVPPPHGTLLLASEHFLKAYILDPLTAVNALTTILFDFINVKKSGLEMSLATWENQCEFNDCRWELVEKCVKYRRYKWVKPETWRYETKLNDVTVQTYTVDGKRSLIIDHDIVLRKLQP
jgi:hypothetical protein